MVLTEHMNTESSENMAVNNMSRIAVQHQKKYHMYYSDDRFFCSDQTEKAPGHD
jgi:hypothetical protein